MFSKLKKIDFFFNQVLVYFFKKKKIKRTIKKQKQKIENEKKMQTMDVDHGEVR